MLPLIIAFSKNPAHAKELSLQHLTLTHGGTAMRTWGELIAVTLLNLLRGESLHQAISEGNGDAGLDIAPHVLETLIPYPDTTVVGKHFSSACYVDHAVPATLYLALKYRDSPEQGLIANTMCGGDNSGRGAVMGALLGALNGLRGWPSRWIDGLLRPPPIVCFESQQGKALENSNLYKMRREPYAI
jgi:ADP-ribosylglycohydrolase